MHAARQADVRKRAAAFGEFGQPAIAAREQIAIVIVGGLIADLVMSIFLLPTLYVWISGENDVLPKVEGDEQF